MLTILVTTAFAGAAVFCLAMALTQKRRSRTDTKVQTQIIQDRLDMIQKQYTAPITKTTLRSTPTPSRPVTKSSSSSTRYADHDYYSSSYNSSSSDSYQSSGSCSSDSGSSSGGGGSCD